MYWQMYFLHRKRIKECKEADSFGNSVFNIKSTNRDKFPLFGSKYMFYLEGVVDCPEFLVHLPTMEAYVYVNSYVLFLNETQLQLTKNVIWIYLIRNPINHYLSVIISLHLRFTHPPPPPIVFVSVKDYSILSVRMNFLAI